MDARITVIEGALRGRSFPLTEAEFTIGRDAENSLTIPDAAVSRQHCVVRSVRDTAPAVFHVQDLDSVNGTYVNDRKISEAQLGHQDRIAIGASLLVFLVYEDDSESVRFEEILRPCQSTMELRSPGVLSGRDSRLVDVIPTSTRLAAHLEALLRIVGAIHSLRGIRAIQERVLELLLETLPGDTGMILLGASSNPETQTAVAWMRGVGACAAPPISRTVFARVVEHGVSVLSSDTAHDEDLLGVESVERERTRSILAVPLRVSDRNIGLIYLQASDAYTFDGDHLKLLVAAGGIAGLALDNADWIERLEKENRRLEAQTGFNRNMVGESPAMIRVYEWIKRLAGSECTVLILGESGTGKELVAQAIHNGSARGGCPFVALNCAVLSDTLLESDLFGHEKGAFTGAVARRQGKLEQAEGGTLFLDEVGELAPQVQAKLLRVLQEREFERVGGSRPIRADVRILAATNKDLLEEASHGRFRTDLYYRLNVVSLTLPPLRSRPTDIPILAEHFLTQSKLARRKMRGISSEARQCLVSYHWPGNVRELQNAIERAIVLGASEQIVPEDLPEEINSSAAPGATLYHEGLRLAKRDLVLNSLNEARGDLREAARILGVHITYLYRLIRQLDIKT
jgi:Nif-specific regulatory protein